MEAVPVNLENATHCGIQANNREVLLWDLKQKAEEVKRAGWVEYDPDAPLLKITMPPCGSTVIYRSFEEIPEESVPCSCGNPDHWFIKYTDIQSE